MKPVRVLAGVELGMHLSDLLALDGFLLDESAAHEVEGYQSVTRRSPRTTVSVVDGQVCSVSVIDEFYRGPTNVIGKPFDDVALLLGGVDRVLRRESSALVEFLMRDGFRVDVLDGEVIVVGIEDFSHVKD